MRWENISGEWKFSVCVCLQDNSVFLFFSFAYNFRGSALSLDNQALSQEFLEQSQEHVLSIIPETKLFLQEHRVHL